VDIVVKKLLVVGIVLLLVGVSIPSTGRVMDKSNPLSVEGDTLYVGGSGSGNYTKIQDAIDNASDGDTVYVYNGTYYENIIINKSISLIGEDKNTTIIDGYNNGVVIKINNCSNVNIYSFTINDGGYKYLEDILILIYSCDNCSISNNFLNNTDPSGVYYVTEGVCLIESNNIQITNNVIYDGLSIALSKSNDNTIAYNNLLKGYVVFGDSSNNNISYNVLSYGWGFELFGSHYNNFHFNEIINIKVIGFYIERSSHCDFYMNNIENCKGTGIQFYRCSNNTFHFNNIKRNTFGIWMDGHGASFYSNNFIKNLLPVLILDVGEYFFDGNYWNRPMNRPKMIIGLKEIMLRPPYTYGPDDPGCFIPIPEILFDWNPAQEPHDI
jgi:parallel beta-helix repeat protein